MRIRFWGVRGSIASPGPKTFRYGGNTSCVAVESKADDLIVLDVQMPKLNGFEVFSKLRADEKLSGVPVIMLTGIAERTGFKFDQKDMGEYMGTQPEAYVDKPIEPIVLKQTINRLLKQSGTSA